MDYYNFTDWYDVADEILQKISDRQLSVYDLGNMRLMRDLYSDELDPRNALGALIEELISENDIDPELGYELLDIIDG